MCALMFNAILPLTAGNVEVIMYIDTEMPCLQSEWLSGKVVINNKGDRDIKLLEEDVVPLFQLYWHPNISEQDAPRAYAEMERGDGMRFSRSTVKGTTDSMVEKSERIVTLRKGESKEIVFEGKEIDAPYFYFHNPRRQIPFAAELYLSPDVWIPVEVRPPVAVAFDAKSGTPVKEGKWVNSNEPWVWRARIDTNEFLFVKTDSASPTYRLGEVHPDDVVTHANKTITITQKNGNIRTIPEKDIPRVSAERKEERRKKAEEGK